MIGPLMKVAGTRPRNSSQEETRIAGDNSGKAPVRPANSAGPDRDQPNVSGTRFNGLPKAGSRCLSPVSVDYIGPSNGLSVRAENVLKTLATELTNEIPPSGRWNPPDVLLRMLTYKHLSTARNCGPHTTAEIIKWAQAKGSVIQPPLYAGKSLSEMWQDTIAKFSRGKISRVEVVEALETSARRKNVRIPLDVQRILIHLVRSSKE